MARKGGAPETVAKALVFECLRQAQEQQRRCCLFAFSTGAELQQLELDLTAAGLGRLLEFLSFAFHGGTSLNEVLLASVERLGSSQQWQNADLLLVTDGEVPRPTDGVLGALGEARAEFGARVYGVVVGSKTGEVMQSLCSVHKELGGKLHFALSDIGNWGLVLHFFCDGFVGGGWEDLWQSVLGGYLNLPSNLIKGCANLVILPFTFSAFLGMLSDSKPIFGFRRRPYMAGGWFLCTLSTLCLVYRGLPAPYYCFENGHYLYQMPPCNPEAADHFIPVVLCLCCATVGGVTANAAANGLLVEYAKQEAVERRGRTQIVLQMVKLSGHLTSVLLSAFGFNGRMFNGSFEQARQLNFQQLMGIYLAAVAVTSVGCLFLVRENKAVRSSFREQMSSVWNLTQSKAFLFVGLFVFLRTLMGHINSTAGVWVMMQWAEVRGIQIQMSNALSLLISLAASYLMRRYLLNTSWRKIIFVTSSVSTATDSIPQLLTVFDIVRDPYFYLGEPISRAVPTAMNHLITVMMANELADDDNGAMVAGMLQSVTFVAILFGMVVSNQLFSSFTPALTLRENFIEDAVSFRWTVAYSYLVAYTFSFASLALLPLAPAQKKQAQARKQEPGLHLQCSLEL
ncbi:viaA [Symbiodinium necroappetens]|uniref:ViaA protein n=1 Tax=Symbiodinium necroappetens TaxID=1628268 RepID=A0A812JDI0_9DINO|nr:viaA [Symbiodinium necroappetens]